MKPSKDCFDLIKKWEGLHKKRSDGLIESYQDPVDIWTIGYGSINNPDLGRPIQPNDVITEATALRWLELEVQEVAEDVDNICKVSLTQGMFDALVSFVYNIGIGAFGESTLLRKLNEVRDYEGAAREFERWVNAGGRVLQGLVNRRDEEERLFRRDGLSPARNLVTSPSNPILPSSASPSLVVERPYQAAPVPLPFSRTLLIGDVAEDCYILNCALAGLGFLRIAPQPNKFSEVTKSAVELLQRREAIQIDGKVGPETKRAIENSLKRSRGLVPSVSTHVICRLTRTRQDTPEGLEWLKLEFVDPDDGAVASLKVISGAPGHQNFLLFNNPASVPGSLQPIPQGRYAIGDLDWAGGRDDYSISHSHPSDGIGPVFVSLTCLQPDDRDAFGFHGDWNWITRGESPGSAGCVCPTNLADLKELVKLLRQLNPRVLEVDWGL
ncbi:glycoside hydrolase family protein [Neosynechococcus sphagnicola]|uniref:glycoside hydrolase family protein n=1 Tax=Neosynechococcus sphagnicola TaxID=1501145 RepID=UPI000691EAAE|nr:glycoside hydrolase family protein [Neosynechococcus sphagnicola]